MIRLFVLLWIFGSQGALAQDYQLLPDSCTFCLHLSSTGGNSWYDNYYGFVLGNDTVYNGNSYWRLGIDPNAWSAMDSQPFAFRQAGNKLFGIVQDSINEQLIIDFDAQENDTIHNLYSEGFLYDALVVNKDSILVNNGVYHHFMQLVGLGYYDQGNYISTSWEFTWNEKALCGFNGTGSNAEDLGGVIYNVPSNFYVISIQYAAAEYCTTDPLYDTPPNVSCQNCVPQTNGVDATKSVEFSITPNPAENSLWISIQDGSSHELTIVDARGQRYFVSEMLNSSQVDISVLTPGIYYAILSSGNVRVVKKFAKL